MKLAKLFLFVLSLHLSFCIPAFAETSLEKAPLDKRYPKRLSLQKDYTSEELYKSDILTHIRRQTSVKSQEARSTCSIFSTIAMLESLLVISGRYDTSIDLSEEWLEYLVMRGAHEDGSDAESNFDALKRWGAALESVMPYVGEEWEKLSDSELAQSRCGHIPNHHNRKLKSCLLGHFDPNYLDLSDHELAVKERSLYDARKQGQIIKEEHFNLHQESYQVSREAQVKYILRLGKPLVLDLDFYYGAWNHPEATNLGIPRSTKQWRNGIVGNPLEGSLDYFNSEKDPTGHSVVVVGYDDSIEIELTHVMKNGEKIKKRYHGVYFFKNSWGTDSFGVDFSLNGVNFPGYGMITQEYAHQHGAFFNLDINP